MSVRTHKRPHSMRVALSKLAESPRHGLDHHVIAVVN
jgi:hypothetical protein